jgi:holo-[acyl-carrier-protein] synthase
MQLLGIGVDIVELARLRDAKHFERVTDFYLLPEEKVAMRQSRDPYQFAASRFAIKEAVIKACPERMWYHDFAVEKEGEKLAIRFKKATKEAYIVWVSVAHEKAYALSSAAVGL